MADKDNVLKNVAASAAFEINVISFSSVVVPVPAETMLTPSTSSTGKAALVPAKACVAGLPQADAKSLVSVCFLRKGGKRAGKRA